MADAIIRAQGLTKIYAGGVGGDVVAVDEIELEINSGEIYGLLGPNGAGKSTTIGMLTTRVVPTRGSILIHGVDLVARPALAKQLIGVVPQSNTLDRAMTVFENLEFHGRYFGMSAKQAKGLATELLQRVRLIERSGAPVMALSGGMAQRLMVARAIMHRPQVLFLDEPTAGLDPQSRIALWEILGDLHDDGQTILLTTHYMEEADEFCDRVAIMDHGRILALDTPEQLKGSIGAGRIVIVSASGDLAALADALVAAVDGAHRARVVEGRIHLSVDASAGLLPRIIDAAEVAGSS
ncbi:MAG TPA: ABC transporter ATP-binding protein, partial [Ilumatobacteraceae bacterium]|nr:ABC transporter ATP-binding protein [Ilumatobacteraceae bacterium]